MGRRWAAADVRNAATDQWVTIGGLIEPNETPRAAAVREGLEETGLHLELLGLRDVIGGPDYWVTYPNRDQVAYVSPVFDARVVFGTMQADGDEVSEVGWSTPAEIERQLHINGFTRAMLRDVGLFARRVP